MCLGPRITPGSSHSNGMFRGKIKLAMWNINGLTQAKHTDDNFKTAVNSVDILFLVETWLSKNIEMKDMYTFSHVRPKHTKAKRFSGGITIIIRKELKSGVKIIQYNSPYFLWVKLDRKFFSLDSDMYVCGVYMPPETSTIYQTYPEPFELLETDILKFSQLGSVALLGDFNARTAEQEDVLLNDSPADNHHLVLPDYYENDFECRRRRSMDRSVNSFVRKLLEICKGSRMRILNGRAVGDQIGNFTSHQTKGQSVVDYAIIEDTLLDRVSSFNVHPPHYLSDHSLIQFGLKVNIIIPQTDQNGTRLLDPEFIWTDHDNTIFSKVISSRVVRDKLGCFESSPYGSSKEEVNRCCTDLSEILISTAQSCLKMKSKNTGSHKARKIVRTGYKELEPLKKLVLSLGRQVQKFPGDRALYEHFHTRKKELRCLAKQKGKEQRALILDKLANFQDKNPSQFWKLVRKLCAEKQIKGQKFPQMTGLSTSVIY